MFQPVFGDVVVEQDSSIDKFNKMIVRPDAVSSQFLQSLIEKHPQYRRESAMYSITSVLNAIIDVIFDCPGRDLNEILWTEESVYTLSIMVNSVEHLMIIYNPGNRQEDMRTYAIRSDATSIADIHDQPYELGDFSNTLHYVFGNVRFRHAMEFLGGNEHPSMEVLEDEYDEDLDNYLGEDVEENPPVNVFISVISGYRVSRTPGNSKTSFFIPTTLAIRNKLRSNLEDDLRWPFRKYSLWENYYSVAKQINMRKSQPIWSQMYESETDPGLYIVHLGALNIDIGVLLPVATKPVRGRGAMSNMWVLKETTPLEMFPLEIRRKILPPGALFNVDRFRYKPSLIGTWVLFYNPYTKELKQLAFLDNHAIYDNDVQWITKTTDQEKVRRFKEAVDAR